MCSITRALRRHCGRREPKTYLELLEVSHRLRAREAGGAAPGESGVGESGQQEAATGGAGGAPGEAKAVLPPLPRPAKRVKQDEPIVDKAVQEPTTEEEEKDARGEKRERSRSVQGEKRNTREEESRGRRRRASPLNRPLTNKERKAQVQEVWPPSHCPDEGTEPRS